MSGECDKCGEHALECMCSGGMKYLRKMRAKKCLTIKDLAEQVKIARTVLTDMENGKRPIGELCARRLGEFFNVNWQKFYHSDLRPIPNKKYRFCINCKNEFVACVCMEIDNER